MPFSSQMAKANQTKLNDILTSANKAKEMPFSLGQTKANQTKLNDIRSSINKQK